MALRQLLRHARQPRQQHLQALLSRAGARLSSSSSSSSGGGPSEYSNAAAHRDLQKQRPLNPHLTHTASASANALPTVGADRAPPELLSAVDAVDAVPENTERLTGGTQGHASPKGDPQALPKADLDVGEMEGAAFKVEPLRRTGEGDGTMRARLLCSFDNCFP